MSSGSQPTALFIKYSGTALLPDANLLVFYFVGCVAPNTIGNHPRTSGFTERDFLLLAQVIHEFQKRGRVLTTPHILTEVSNLLRQGKLPGDFYGAHLESFVELFRSHIMEARWTEEHIPARDLVQSHTFRRHGLTDAAIAHLSPKKTLVLSTDGGLVRDLTAKNLDAIWFDDMRREYLG